MKIVVTGGLGFVGHSLVRNLLLEGHEVHALGRTVNPPKDKLVKGLHYHSHDLSKQKVAAQWFKGTDTVFHVAAKRAWEQDIKHTGRQILSLRSIYFRHAKNSEYQNLFTPVRPA